MYMSLFRKLYGLKPNNIVHVGAHLAEERSEYERSGILGTGVCIWVEAQPDKAAYCRKLFRDSQQHRVIEALVWSKSNVEMVLNITNETASSSVFSLEDHKNIYPEIEVIEKLKKRSSTLFEILPKDIEIDFMVLDIQGAELEALIGLGDRIKEVKWIYTEVSRRDLYKFGVQYSELNKYLEDRGFVKKFVEWDRNAGWGDALYLRRELWQTSAKLEIQRFFMWLYRRLYSRIPQPVFPILVKFKRGIRNWISS